MGSSLLECSGDGGEGLLGFTHHDVVGELEGAIGIAAGPGTSNEGAAAKFAGAEKDVAGMEALRVHRADHDQVSGEEIFVTNLLKALVHEADLPGWRAECGYGDEAERRRHGGFGKHFEHAFKAPERGRKARPDHEDVDVGAEGWERDLIFVNGWGEARVGRRHFGQLHMHG